MESEKIQERNGMKKSTNHIVKKKKSSGCGWSSGRNKLLKETGGEKFKEEARN